MAGERCVDTSVIVRLLNGEPGLLEKFNAAPQIFIAPVVVGELLFGAFNSTRRIENVAKIEAFLEDVAMLDWSRRVSQVYADAKLALRSKGTPIPENDLWIAAFSLAYQIPLAARDEHFSAVGGLSIDRR